MDQDQPQPFPSSQPAVNPNSAAAPPSPPIQSHHSENSAVHIVWQWVSYALWEGALITLSILLSATLSYYFIERTGNYVFTTYVMAAMLCLLPLAFVADRIYAKFEPPQKHGFAAVVMVLNAIAVFLATIGALITFVVSLLSFAVDANSSDGKSIVVVSSLIVLILGALLFIRIIHVPRLARASQLFRWIVVGVAGLTLVLTLAGPFRSQIATRDDRLIESNLSDVSSTIQSYAQTDNHLPASLSDLSFSSYQTGDKTLVARKLVTYQSTSAAKPSANFCSYSSSTNNTQNCSTDSSNSLAYTLCVTYKRAKGDQSSTTFANNSPYIDTSTHPAGHKCYPETATTYLNNQPVTTNTD